MSRAYVAFEPYPDRQGVLDYLEDRFGITAELLSAHRVWHRPGSPPIWIAHQNVHPPAGLAVDTLGIPLLRRPPPRGYPTHAFLQRFGPAATRRVIIVDSATAHHLMGGGTAPWSTDDAQHGPFIVRCDAVVLGRGWLRDGRLILDFPKARRLAQGRTNVTD